jgi:hypothetical protein
MADRCDLGFPSGVRLQRSRSLPVGDTPSAIWCSGWRSCTTSPPRSASASMWPWPPPARCPHWCDKHSGTWSFDVGLGSATPTTVVRLRGRGRTGATWLTRRRASPTTELRCGDDWHARTQCCSPRLSRPAEIWPPRDAVARVAGCGADETAALACYDSFIRCCHRGLLSYVLNNILLVVVCNPVQLWKEFWFWHGIASPERSATGGVMYKFFKGQRANRFFTYWWH